MGAKINVSLHYPYSEEYDYESYLEHINLTVKKSRMSLQVMASL